MFVSAGARGQQRTTVPHLSAPHSDTKWCQQSCAECRASDKGVLYSHTHLCLHSMQEKLSESLLA